jgi:MFS family permease
MHTQFADRPAAVAEKPLPVLPYEPSPPGNRIPRHLYGLFAWLFWGDFILVLMEQAVPKLVPILLTQHKVSGTAMGFMMGTIPLAFGLLIMPIISYRSDQLRTRWGRRVPFIMVATPLIMASLCLIPLSPMIARTLGMGHWGLLALFTITITAYTFFNAVCAACYSYLVPDVVPQQYLGRFMSLFRVMATLGVFVFGYGVMGVAQNHMVEVFIGAAVVYGIGFSIVFLKVREPHYPPPTDKPTSNPITVFLSYGRECFRHPLYVWMYISFAAYSISQMAGNLFDVLFLNKTLGMDLGPLGKMLAWTSIAVVPIGFVFGGLVDRLRVQRMIVISALLLAAGKLAGFFYIQGEWSYFTITVINNIFSFFWGVSVAAYVAGMFPKDRFGQFASCQGFIVTLVGLVMNPVCGVIFDWVGNYRYVFLWPAIGLVLTAACLAKVNQYWRRCGGPDAYIPP